MKEERLQRRPRYKRTPSDDLGVRLQDRDREILKIVHAYRFLTSQQIQRLVAGSDQVLLRRLQKLFHASYLDRLKTSNNDAILYALGNKGADELALWGEISNRGTIDWTSKNREAKERYLAHTMMIANFRATLTLALREKPGMQIVRWVPEGELKEEVTLRCQAEVHTPSPP